MFQWCSGWRMVNRLINRPESDAILFPPRQILPVWQHFVSSLFLWKWVTHCSVTALQMIGQTAFPGKVCVTVTEVSATGNWPDCRLSSSQILSLPASREWGWLYTAGLMRDERWARWMGKVRGWDCHRRWPYITMFLYQWLKSQSYVCVTLALGFLNLLKYSHSEHRLHSNRTSAGFMCPSDGPTRQTVGAAWMMVCIWIPQHIDSWFQCLSDKEEARIVFMSTFQVVAKTWRGSSQSFSDYSNTKWIYY